MSTVMLCVMLLVLIEKIVLFSNDYKFPVYTSKLLVSSSLFTIMLCFVFLSMKIKNESRLRCAVCFSFYYMKDLWLWLGMFVLHSKYHFCLVLFIFLIFMCTLGVLVEVNMQIYVLCCVHEFVHLLFYKQN